MNELVSRVRKQINSGLFHGAVILDGGRNRPLRLFCFGSADPLAGTPMRPDTVFDIASVSKVVGTAAATAVLIEEGKIDPDRPFADYLPDYRVLPRPTATVRDLAMHISGFDNNKPYEHAANLIDGVRDTAPVRPAGEKFEYACINFILLGMIVESVSGVSLQEFARRAIFTPLGMSETNWGKPFPHQHARIARMLNAAPGIVSDESARFAMPHCIGNAGLFSTAADLARFADAMLRLRSDSILLRIVELPLPGAPRRSFGWDAGTEFRPDNWSDKTLYHSGFTGQTLWIDPENGRFAAVLTNRCGDWAEAKRGRLAICSALDSF